MDKITSSHYFGKLNEMLIKYKDKGDILIMGDLAMNARTGNEDGLHEDLGKQLSHLLPGIEVITLETGNRCSSDVKVNTPGRKLLTFCSSHSLELPNDQTPGDRLGNLTCFNNMGASVVDFLVLSRSLMKNVINFKVFHPTLIPSMHQLLLLSRVLLLNLEKEKSSTIQRQMSGITRVLFYFTPYWTKKILRSLT